MAIYPALFGHVELPDAPSTRRDRKGSREIGIRLVRPIDTYRDHRHENVRRES